MFVAAWENYVQLKNDKTVFKELSLYYAEALQIF